MCLRRWNRLRVPHSHLLFEQPYVHDETISRKPDGMEEAWSDSKGMVAAGVLHYISYELSRFTHLFQPHEDVSGTPFYTRFMLCLLHIPNGSGGNVVEIGGFNTIL